MNLKDILAELKARQYRDKVAHARAAKAQKQETETQGVINHGRNELNRTW